jgi:hypothetical protein
MNRELTSDFNVGVGIRFVALNYVGPSRKFLNFPSMVIKTSNSGVCSTKGGFLFFALESDAHRILPVDGEPGDRTMNIT